ncbi:MAG TPA: carboxypeptidase regulatory-like domain-containing protein [Bryobacteraceae bacterium]|nr:carboxypeptidase regulatory-like domain-containing protein [Bryobacteraceae bacterium]
MRSQVLLRSRLASVALLTLLFAICVPSLVAQSAGTAGLAGTVTDPSGAAIPNVTVTITNNDTGQTRSATTGPDGQYKFTLLPPGSYRVRFAAMGFKTAEVTTVTLNVTETPTLDRALEVGQQSEQVTVEASAEILQTQSSTLGTTVGEKVVTALPLSNRNYTQILGLSAGVNGTVNNATNFGKATNDFSVNGADPGQNNYQMDGVAINNIANGGSSNDSGIYAGIGIPNPDAIQEFKIQTSTYDASYGRNPGANVNVVTKSGSNVFHGGVWYFFRNEDLDANDFFDNSSNGGARQVFRQNQVGGDVGGPIKKDKLFFFANYQETRQLNGVASQGVTTQLLPPLPPGDRSAPGYQAALGAALCPANHPGQGFGPFLPFLPSLNCDGSNISPVALNYLNIKLPNGQYYIPSSGTSGFVPTFITDPATYVEHQLILNGDYLVNEKNTLAARYFYTQNPQTLPLSGGLPGAPAKVYYANTDAVLKLTTLVTPTLVNELRGSFQRNDELETDTTPATPQSLGQTPNIPTETEMTPIINFGGPTTGGTLAPSYSPTTQMQVADQVSWSHGKHTIRAGYEYEETQWNITFGGLERGLVFIGAFNDFLIGGNGDILQCLFCTRSGPGGLIHGYRLPNQDAFVQDDWKVSSKLTMNLGVRWEYDGAFSDKYGNLTNVWASQLASVPNSQIPNAPPSNIYNPGANYLAGYVVPNNYISHYGNPPTGVLISNRGLPVSSGPPLTNFGPRIGFAYQAASKLVIRGGFGIFYDRIAGDRFVHSVEQGNPYGETLDYAGAGASFATLANLYPSSPPVGVFAARWANFQTGQTSNLNTPSLDQDLHTPLVRQYNLTLQYEFAPNWVLETGYVGSSGINLVDTYQGQNTPGLASPSNPVNGLTYNTVSNAALRVPYLGFQPAGYQPTSFNAISRYNSLQVTLRKRFSHGLTMQASYTFSKDLTNLSQANANNISADSNVPENLSQQMGPAWFSRPNRFIVNYSYDLPFGNHTGGLGLLANGWNLSGVTTVQDGTPLTIENYAGGTAYGLGTFVLARAQMCPGMTYSNVPTPGGIEARLGGASGGPGYINTAAIGCAPPIAPNSLPDPVTGALPTLFGNSGPGILLGPGEFNWDMSLIKTTKITERQTVQLRFEFFNAFNHPQFAPPGGIGAVNPQALQIGSPTFGQITGPLAVNPRVIQFGFKYMF